MHGAYRQENVVSNVMKGARLSELSGMAPESVISGVQIWRPLLSHPKAHILSCAHAHGVPYLNDSTPLWSTRGKLRKPCHAVRINSNALTLNL